MSFTKACFTFFCLIISTLGHCEQGSSFKRPPHISQEVWEKLSPHLIPDSHPAKKTMDSLFGGRHRVTQSSKTLRKAGFKKTEPRKYSGTIVTYHKELKGYFIKLYSDEQKEYCDWQNLYHRIAGANLIRNYIEAKGWQHHFKVPRKWLYLLPETPAPPQGTERKNFVLLVEDMNIHSSITNLRLWKSNALPEETLDVVFLLLSELGLNDSPYAFNLPFAKDGRIALIDTEYYHVWPVKYSKLTKYLSEKNKVYWKQLIQK